MTRSGLWRLGLSCAIGAALAGACGSTAERRLERDVRPEGGAGGEGAHPGGVAGSEDPEETPEHQTAGAGNPSGGGGPTETEPGGSSGAGGDLPEVGGAGGETSTQPLSAYLYAAGPGGKIAGWSVNATSGALTLLAGSPFTGSVDSFAEHPSGKAIFAADYDGSTASAFRIDGAGALVAIGAPSAAGSTTEVVKVHPSGKFLYAGNINGGGTSIYAIDPQTFALTATAPLDFGLYHHGLAFHPSGDYFYLARNNNNDVTRFVVDQQTGAPSAPQTIAAAGGYHAAMDPLGKYLFVSDWDKGGANKVSSYSLSAVDGTLSKVGDYETGGTNPAGIVVTPDGRWVYLVNSQVSVAGFAVNRATGVLTPVPGSPFTGGSWELCLDHSGRFLYVGAPTGLLGYAINQTTGALAALAGSPFDGGIDSADPWLGACVVTRKPD